MPEYSVLTLDPDDQIEWLIVWGDTMEEAWDKAEEAKLDNRIVAIEEVPE